MSEKVQLIKKGICPTCKRYLKPHNEEHDNKDIDYLVCRYCKLKIRTSAIRTNSILKEYKDQEIKEKIQEEYLQRVRQNKYGARPEKCVSCGSTNLREDAYEDYSWECLDCEDTFQWRLYNVVYSGDIDVYAKDRDMARQKAYDYIGEADIEAEVSWEVD